MIIESEIFEACVSHIYIRGERGGERMAKGIWPGL